MRFITRHHVAVVAAVAALAAMPSAAAAQPPAVPDITDQEFLSAAAQSNRFEILTGKLATRRGHARVVRRLGRQFVRHHTAQLALGSAVAKKLGIVPAPGINAEQQRATARLGRKHGRAFDRLWLKVQRRAHKEAIALHVRAGVNGDTPDVRTLAVTGLPVIGQHFGELLIAGGHHRH